MSITAEALRELHRIHTQLGDLRERLARGPKQILAREGAVKRFEEALAKAQADSKAARVSGDQKQLALKSGEAKIVDLQVKLNGCKTNREYQALTGVSQKQTVRDLNELVKANQLQRKGSGRATYYELRTG